MVATVRYDDKSIFLYIWWRVLEVQDSRVTKLSHKTELRKMNSHFALLTQKVL